MIGPLTNPQTIRYRLYGQTFSFNVYDPMITVIDKKKIDYNQFKDCKRRRIDIFFFAKLIFCYEPETSILIN